MALEFKIRVDTREFKKLEVAFQKQITKNARLKQATLRTKQGFDKLNTAALRNSNALRRAELQTRKITLAEKKLAASTNVAAASQNRMRRSTTGLAASVGALRNQILLVTFAFAGVAAAVKKIIDAGSDLNEAQNLVAKTFGDSAVEVENFAEKAAGAIGQTRGEALKLLGDLGSVTKGFGFTEKAASNFSQTALQLASDIGSLKNATTPEVLNAFRSAIVGQSEPMLRFGSDVRVATLQQIALEEGIINTKRELTNQEKAVAALAQVYRTNKDAIDDFKETQNEFATASKISAAKLREIVETLGTKMLPAAAQAAVGLTILIDNFDLVKKAARESFTFPIITERFGVDLVTKTTEMFKNMQNSLRENAEKARDDDSFFAPLLTLMAKMVGVDDETQAVVKEKTKTSLDELLALFKNAQTKFEAAFDIGEGVEQAILNLGDGMRDVGDGLEKSVLPPMEDMSNAMSDIAIDAEKFRIQMETARLTRFPSIPKIKDDMKAASRAAASFSASLAQAAIFSRDLKSIFRSLVGTALNIGFNQAFGVPGFAHGTNFAPGGAAIVGERGPELVNLPRGSQVIPNQTTNNTNNNVSFNMPNVKTFDRFTVENQLMPLIREQLSEGDFL